MKITVNINLAGMPFVIDEDACKVLKSYLDDIASRLSGQSDDSYGDVECRVAEIFRDNGVGGLRVVSMFHVKEAISIIGQPDVFGEGKTSYRPENNEKRLLRDPENRIFGGVCSGVSIYFGLDTSLMRVALILLTMLGGAGFLIYIISWIVIPVASTSAELAALEDMRKRKK